MTEFHERARQLIALSGPEKVPSGERAWLAEHLESCASCREFADNIQGLIHSLRSIPVTAGGGLVSTTQMRVRQRALELQRQQERRWVISICCAAVTLCGSLTTAILWRGIQWIGQTARFSEPGREMTFLVLCFMPAILTGVLLLARGSYLTNSDVSREV